MSEVRYVVPFDELDRGSVELVGGKCANLGELTQAGFPVPPGFAVTTHAHGRDDVAPAIAAGYAALAARVGRSDPPVAVRSSAVAEDLPDASFAGLQDTYLWLAGLDAIVDGVRRCWASFHNPEAVAYREQHGIARGGMSVAVQYMVDARVAGVLFTLNPVNGDRSSIAIDASYGLGVTVVGGDVTPDSFLYSKVTRELVRTTLGTKAIECVTDAALGRTVTRDVPVELRGRLCLAPDEVTALAELGRQVEQHYGAPQDVEWAIDRQLDAILLLQARPETVWSGRRREYVAADSAVAAVANAYLPKR